MFLFELKQITNQFLGTATLDDRLLSEKTKGTKIAIDYSRIDYNSNFDQKQMVKFAEGQKMSLKNAKYVMIESTEKNQDLNAQQKKERIDAINKADNWNALGVILNKYDDLFKVFTDWVKLNYDKRLQDETARIIRPSAKMPKVVVAPGAVAETSRKAAAEVAKAEKIAKEYNVLRETPGQGYGFEPGFGPAGSSFAVPC